MVETAFNLSTTPASCVHNALCPLAPSSSLEHRIRAFLEYKRHMDTVSTFLNFVWVVTALALLALLRSELYGFIVMLLFGCSRHDLSVGVFMQTPYTKVAL